MNLFQKEQTSFNQNLSRIKLPPEQNYEYFKIDNWDFGDTFYFSELAAYLHKELGDYISSVVITPKYSSNEFTNLLSISCALNEVFMAVTTSNDVKIITQLAQSELVGE